MQYINEYKSLIFPTKTQLQNHRLTITEQQLTSIWQTKTLTEMQSILTVTNQYILSIIIDQFLRQFLSTNKLQTQAYTITKQQTTLMNQLYQKQDNDFLSGFLICFKEQEHIQQSLHEFVSTHYLEHHQWTLKVKQSAILRIFAHLKSLRTKLSKRDHIIIPPEYYYTFMLNWLQFNYSYTLQGNIRYFFEGIAILLQNQILLEYFNTLNQKQKYQRMYKRATRIIDKPRNVQQFTLIQNTFYEISWQSLKLTAFKLKYKIVETEHSFECYRLQEQEQYQPDPTTLQLSPQDLSITESFSKLRQLQQVYPLKTSF